MAELDVDPADASHARVDVADEDGTPVFRVSGELDMPTAARVRTAVDTALAGARGRVVFDMSGLDFMDSSGLALLLSVAQRVPVEVRKPSPIVRRLIQLTGLENTLRMVL
jgi:anti-sigma B factor antagonist